MQVSRSIRIIFQESLLTAFPCRTDIIFALQHGGSTSFFRDRMNEVRNSLQVQNLPLDRELNVPWTKYDNLDPYLEDIFLDAMDICSLFNQLGGKTVDYTIFLEVLISLCYRLLRFRSLHDANILADNQSAYHIGLVVFMMSLFLQNDRCRLINYILIPTCLKNLLQDELRQDMELSFWLLMIGGIWISDEPEHKWLNPKLRATAHWLGLTCWDDVKRSVCKFPWINGLHDQLGRSLWERVQDYY